MRRGIFAWGCRPNIPVRRSEKSPVSSRRSSYVKGKNGWSNRHLLSGKKKKCTVNPRRREPPPQKGRGMVGPTVFGENRRRQ